MGSFSLSAAALLLVAMCSPAYGAAFVTTVQTRHAWDCRRAGKCPQLSLRRTVHTPALAPTRVSRHDTLVMMAKKKPKMSEAQLKALEALEAFEAATGDSTAVEQAPDPAEEEKKKKKAEKKAKLAAKKAAQNPEAAASAAAAPAPSSADTEDKAAPAPSGKKKKKGKMSDVQLRALEALEAFESSGSSAENEHPSDNESANDNEEAPIVQVILCDIFLVSCCPSSCPGLCSPQGSKLVANCTICYPPPFSPSDISYTPPSHRGLSLIAPARVPVWVLRVCDVVGACMCSVLCPWPWRQQEEVVSEAEAQVGSKLSGHRAVVCLLQHASTVRTLGRGANRDCRRLGCAPLQILSYHHWR